nr:hypothetical protein [Tanacetum cinerariifolium]
MLLSAMPLVLALQLRKHATLSGYYLDLMIISTVQTYRPMYTLYVGPPQPYIQRTSRLNVYRQQKEPPNNQQLTNSTTINHTQQAKPGRQYQRSYDKQTTRKHSQDCSS